MSATKLNHKKRVFSPALVCLYGKMGPLGENQKMARHLGKNLGAKSLCSILPGVNTQHKVVEHQPDEILDAVGIILRHPGQGAIFTSCDCPIVTIVNKNTGEVGVAYAGRWSLLKASTDCDSCSVGVLEELFASMTLLSGEDMQVYVSGGISVRHYTHQNEEELLPFIRKFGNRVVPDRSCGTLNLFRVIAAICRRYGISDKNISSDGLCTYETPWLGSKRAGKDGSNWTYVIKTQ